MALKISLLFFNGELHCIPFYALFVSWVYFSCVSGEGLCLVVFSAGNKKNPGSPMYWTSVSHKSLTLNESLNSIGKKVYIMFLV